MHFSPPGCLGCCPFIGGGSVVHCLFLVTPIAGVCNCSMFCCTLLFALLNLSSWCIVMVEGLFVIVVFPDHTHLLFLVRIRGKIEK